MKEIDYCADCELATSILKKYVSEKATQEELVQLINQKVCLNLSEDLQPVCIKFLTTEKSKLFKFLQRILVRK